MSDKRKTVSFFKDVNFKNKLIKCDRCYKSFSEIYILSHYENYHKLNLKESIKIKKKILFLHKKATKKLKNTIKKHVSNFLKNNEYNQNNIDDLFYDLKHYYIE